MDQKLSIHRFHVLTAMFMLISFMLGCNEFMVVGNLTLIANTYHESLSQISWLIAVFSWTYAIATPIVTLLTNRIHKYYLLIGLLIIFLGGSILSSISPSLGWLMVSRVITASVAGIIESLMSVIVYQLTDDHKLRSMAVAYIYTGFSLASVIGLPIGTIIADHFGWKDAFVMVAGITLIAMIVALFILPRNLAAGEGGIKDQLILFKDRHIWFGIIFVTCAAATLYGYYTYIRPLIHQTLHFSTDQLSMWLLLIGVVDLLANQTSGRIAAGNGFKTLRPVYLLDLVLLASFSLMMRNQWSGIGLILILTFTVSLFGSPIQVFFLNEATKKYPSSVNLASTLSAMFYNVGIAFSSMTAGRMLKHFGLTSMGFNSMIYCLIATVMVFVLAKISIKNN